jgi:hypothetical protein
MFGHSLMGRLNRQLFDNDWIPFGNAVMDFQSRTNLACHCIGVFSDAVLPR